MIIVNSNEGGKLSLFLVGGYMDIELYYNMSDDRTVNKTLELDSTLVGEFRDEVSMVRPVVRVENDGSPIRANYVRIPDFQRYYYISNVTAYRHGVWDLELAVDVLMSFRGDIANLNAIIDRTSIERVGDEYIDDGGFVVKNVTSTEVYNFPNGFNENPELILITAG